MSDFIQDVSSLIAITVFVIGLASLIVRLA